MNKKERPKHIRLISSAGERTPRCPLCLQFMSKHFDHINRFAVWACDRDRVAIRTDDKFVGRWEEAQDAIERVEGLKLECPFCRSKMRFFCTSVGYQKSKCSKETCQAGMATTEPDRVNRAEGETTKGLIQ